MVRKGIRYAVQKAAAPADPVALAQVIPIFEEVHLNQAH